ncbi:hypothetical protein NXS19_004542 [Fusarium pseudograminearum]|nr:hypothetical protein NXS19_004542 [Fusarium pseudograminearum]
MSVDSKRNISLSSLPFSPNVIFHESSFFSRNQGKLLPTLSEILTESIHQHRHSYHGDSDPPPVVLESLGLLVKFSQRRVHIAEGQCLWALKHFLPEVPAPEIYGWTIKGDYVILYMELVKAVSVEQRWPFMTDDEKTVLWKAFRTMFDNLRKLSQEPNDHFIRRINRGPLFDEAIDTPKDPRPGPFASVKNFHDWWSITIRTGAEIHWPGLKPKELPDLYRAMVPDDAAIVFTHANLHCSNILVDSENPFTIIAIINWDYSGW